MDRRRAGSPVFTRQRSAESSSTGSSSPAMSPAHPRAAGGLSGIKRSQNVAAKAAAARLAQVMATQTAADHEDEEEEEEEDGLLPPGSGVGGFRFGPPRQIPNANGGSGGGGSGRAAAASAGVSLRANRSPSPALGRNFVEPIPSIRATSAGRPSSISTRTTPSVPPSRTTLRTPSPVPPIQPQVDASRNKGFLSGIRHGNSRETGNNREDSALQDELDMLQEENDNVRAKLRLMEERCEEADARARELEKQVAALGDGVSIEAKLLSRKEAALRQREAALKAAAQTKDGKDEEVSALRHEVDSLRDRASSATEQCLEAEAEVKSLRSMTQRMILTQEEMEEVVLKRCWLARYWGLALQHGVYADIAISKHEHWSSLAPLPFEVVVSAGQKAKDESCYGGDDDPQRRNNLVRDLNDIIGEGNIESMLAVEKGLRELASLKVEDAVVLAMAQLHRPNFVRISNTDLKSPGDPKFMEALELSQEESEDVFFKQAWLTYFWRRAKAHGVEEDIAEERLQFWIGRGGLSLTLHDAVDVERGLVELRKLGIEQQLWEASRRDLDQNSALANTKPAIDLETASR